MGRALACALAALLAALPAGCTTPPHADVPPPGFVPGHLELSGCQGWTARSPGLPMALAPGTAPPGWEPDGERVPPPVVAIMGFDCQRLSLDGFERGPVRLVLDSHDRATVPKSCWDPSGWEAFVLNALWVDDAAVAAHLAEAYGMPVHAGRIDAAERSQRAVALHDWSWDGGASSMTVAGDATDGGSPVDALLFWTRGTGLGSLALDQEGTGPVPAPRWASGTLAPPMVAPGPFAGTGEWRDSLEAGGDLRLFRDLLCQVPA